MDLDWDGSWIGIYIWTGVKNLSVDLNLNLNLKLDLDVNLNPDVFFSYPDKYFFRASDPFFFLLFFRESDLDPVHISRDPQP